MRYDGPPCFLFTSFGLFEKHFIRHSWLAATTTTTHIRSKEARLRIFRKRLLSFLMFFNMVTVSWSKAITKIRFKLEPTMRPTVRFWAHPMDELFFLVLVLFFFLQLWVWGCSPGPTPSFLCNLVMLRWGYFTTRHARYAVEVRFWTIRETFLVGFQHFFRNDKHSNSNERCTNEAKKDMRVECFREFVQGQTHSSIERYLQFDDFFSFLLC